MKKIISLALCMIMVLAVLSACGKTTLEGKWTAKVDMTDMLFGELGGEDGDFDKVEVDFTLELKKDGTYATSMDVDAFKDALNAAKPQLEKVLKDELEGLGMSMDDVFDMMFSEESLKELADETKTEGKYKAEDGKIFFSNSLDEDPADDNYVEYELGSKLTFTKSSGSDVFAEEILPLVFKK